MIEKEVEIKKPARSSNKPLWNKALKAAVRSYWKENYLVFLLLAGIVTVVYIMTLANDLVSDDKGLVNPQNFSSFSTIFADPFAALRLTFYALVYPICQDVPACYRLPSILTHLGNSILLFMLVHLLVKKKEVAFFSSILFAVHPVLVETVSWISAGAYSVYTFFFLISLLLYILSEKIDEKYLNSTLTRGKIYWAGMVVLLIAVFTTNRVMALPIFFLYELSFGSLRNNWKKLIPVVVLSGVWVLVHLLQVSGRVTAIEATGSGEENIYKPFFLWPFAVGNYFKLLFWPDSLSFYHTDYIQPAREMFLRWAILLGFLIFSIYTFFKKRALFFWAAFFWGGLLLYLVPVQLAWLVAERYVYLSSIGIFVLVAILLAKISSKQNLKMAVLICFWILVVILGIRSIVRTLDWKNEDTLLLSVLRTNPENAKGHNQKGIIHGKDRNYSEAIKEFEEAVHLDPMLVEAYHNLGNAYDEQGRNLLQATKDSTASAQLKNEVNSLYEKAIPYYEKALSLNPNHWLSYQQLANIYFDLGDYQKTVDNILKILPINPNPQFLTNLGYVYALMGEKDKAIQAYSEALRVNPQDQAAAQALRQLQSPVSSAPQIQTPKTNSGENDPLPGGQLPPEVLKAIQEQGQKGALSSP